MAFELSFTADFFMLPDEYDGAEYPHGDRPYSVLGAIRAMDEETWNSMCEEVFHCKPEFVTEETVLLKIEETNTCGTLSSPVDVWIDEEGYYTVDVYDHEERPRM